MLLRRWGGYTRVELLAEDWSFIRHAFDIIQAEHYAQDHKSIMDGSDDSKP